MMADPDQSQLLEHYRLSPASISPSSRRKHEADWVRGSEIGQGSCGVIYLETESNTGAARAVKEIRKSRAIDFRHELVALTRLAKPAYAENFGKFLGWWETETAVAFALEYFEHGDLRKFLQEPWVEDNSKDVAIQLLSGLSVMHRDGITHRDLKPENIFVVHTKPFFGVKIGDFGVSKRINDNNTILRTQVGTRYYQSPEVLEFLDDDNDTVEYTSAVDIWAVGIVIFETLTSSRPFADLKSLKKYCQKKVSFPVDLLASKRVSSKGISAVNAFLERYPRDRPTAEAALMSDWFETAPTFPDSPKTGQYTLSASMRSPAPPKAPEACATSPEPSKSLNGPLSFPQNQPALDDDMNHLLRFWRGSQTRHIDSFSRRYQNSRPYNDGPITYDLIGPSYANHSLRCHNLTLGYHPPSYSQSRHEMLRTHYEGVTLRKDMTSAHERSPSWKCVVETPFTVSLDQLSREKWRHQDHVQHDLARLRSQDQWMQIFNLLKTRMETEPDEYAHWSIFSIHKEIGPKEVNETETKAIHLVLRRSVSHEREIRPSIDFRALEGFLRSHLRSRIFDTAT